MKFTTQITHSSRNETLRSVFFTMPHVAPLGVDWTAKHEGRKFELTSFKGGPVEVYCENKEGLMVYQGNVRYYAPGADLQQCFREVWTKEQPSKAAKEAFEKSASEISCSPSWYL